jgi:integrase
VGKRYPYLHKRGNWYYFFWKDKDGKRFEESLRTKDIEVAVQKYHQRLDEIRRGRSPNNLSGRTLLEVTTDRMDGRQLEITRASYQSERSIVQNLLRVFGAGSRLTTLADAPQLRRYQQVRLKEGASPKTVNNELTAFSGILREANLWHRVEGEYKRLRVRKSDVPGALTLEESERLMAFAAKSAPRSVAPAVAVLGLSTGLRKGEIARIKLGDLHNRDVCPHLMVRRETTKTDAGARRVALDQCAVWAVERLVARARLIGSVNPEDYLLPTDLARHTRLSDGLHGGCGFDPQHHQTSWEWGWDEFRKAAGISHRRFHDLRHSYVTRAAEAGVPAAVLQAQVGHVSNEMLRW